MTSAIGGADPTRKTTTAEFALNDVVSDGKGSVYVYIQAGEALTSTSAVIIDEAGQTEMVDTTSTASAFGDRVGVVSVAFDDNDFGWAQIYGPTTLNVVTACAANTLINSTATAGRLDDDSTTGAEAIDGIVTTAAEASNAAAAILNYPSVSTTLT